MDNQLSCTFLEKKCNSYRNHLDLHFFLEKCSSYRKPVKRETGWSCTFLQKNATRFENWLLVARSLKSCNSQRNDVGIAYFLINAKKVYLAHIFVLRTTHRQIKQEKRYDIWHALTRNKHRGKTSSMKAQKGKTEEKRTQ